MEQQAGASRWCTALPDPKLGRMRGKQKEGNLTNSGESNYVTKHNKTFVLRNETQHAAFGRRLRFGAVTSFQTEFLLKL